MKIITRQELADGAARRWKEAYLKSDGKTWSSSARGLPPKADTYAELIKLAIGTPPDVIDKTIGNGSWTNLSCDECQADGVDAVVQVGEEPDYESCTANLCLDCVAKLTALTPLHTPEEKG